MKEDQLFYVGLKAFIKKDALFIIGYNCNYVSGEVILESGFKSYRWIGVEDFKKLTSKARLYNIFKQYFENE